MSRVISSRTMLTTLHAQVKTSSFVFSVIFDGIRNAAYINNVKLRSAAHLQQYTHPEGFHISQTYPITVLKLTQY